MSRHHRYLESKDPRAGQMFAVVLPDGQRAGVIGYRERPWRGELLSAGWNVLPAFQGRGIATAAARRLHPLGDTDFEYPPGSVMRCHDWRREL